MRETMLMIATGQMGVGKTYTTEQDLQPYCQRHRKERKVLIFDVNNEEYFLQYKTVLFDIEEIQAAKVAEKKLKKRIITKSEKRIGLLAPGQIRRVAPFTRSGVPMNKVQQRLTFEVLLENFRSGLVFFEDVNKYISAFADDRVTGSFKAIRHLSQDIILHMQSMLPVRPLLIEAAYVFRMHYDGVDLRRMKDRLGSSYEILRLAQLIVDDEFLNKGNPRFYCYVYHKIKKLKGVSEEQFEYACQKYLIENKNATELLAHESAREARRLKPNFDDKEKARHQWILKRKEVYLGIAPPKPARSPKGDSADQ